MLSPGTRLGPYEIAESIGAGGMGQVYRAFDRELKRDVAIKVLPASFANDADRLARFKREAEMLASLNHANIAHVYGLERGNGTTALAMELVEGATLADRIARGRIPVNEALAVARQLTDALEAAHARGIVHRDLKPANIKLAPDGTVKVLDFGIAKAVETRATYSGSAATEVALPMTEAGIVLGTAAYMSPEQARGQPVDVRTDVWAFACVLYEMLTGRSAFGAEDTAATLARVLEREPDLAALPASIAPAVRRTIEVCLEKDLRKRLRHIGDARLALDGTFAAPSSSTSPAGGARRWIPIGIVALAIVALGVPTLRHLGEVPAPPPPETHVDIVTPATDNPEHFALSPDGRQVVVVVSADRTTRLWLRSLADGSERLLPGTDGAMNPFWSPDGESIGFFADYALRKLELSSGSTQVLATVLNGTGSWNADDAIVFSVSATSPLWRVAANGGAPMPISTLGPRHSGHVSPRFLPDGHHLLFHVQGGAEVGGIYLGDLDGRTPIRLAAAEGHAEFLPSGWVLWVSKGTLLAQRLDVDQAKLVGEVATFSEDMSTDQSYRSGVSASSTGLVGYRTGASERRLNWVDRSGATLGALGEPDGNDVRYPRVTRDGRRAVVARSMRGNLDLWLVDGTREKRLTFDPSRDDYPQLSPDGIFVVFRSERSNAGDLYIKRIATDDPEELLLASNQVKVPTGFSKDGRFLLYMSVDPQDGADLLVLPLEGERTPWEFVKTEYREAYATFSPDGRWVAYQSNKSGRSEIYIRSFVPPGAENRGVQDLPASKGGGIHPQWNPDGTELYYVSPTGFMMAVPIMTVGDSIEPATPQALFPIRIARGHGDNQQGAQYDIAADGHFLINTELDDDVGVPIRLIQNWQGVEPR